ncbi:MAG: mitochondrial fission ELM1 family protein [Parvibaculaceae bacterium]
MRAESPLVWVLQGLRPGDNAQARELAARLSAPTETKHLRYNWLYRLPNYVLGAGLASVRQGAEGLTPPWPDLVIGIGRRSVPVARWIKRKSGGRTRLVHLGRPRARLDIFDLVITTPQYGLPSAPNVIELTLPLVPEQSLPEPELASWRAAFADLPRPLIAVLIGGPARPFLMRNSEMADLINEAERMRRTLGGALVVIGSPRTPRDVFNEAVGALGVHCRHFGWSAGQANPYRALLQLADRFIVTSDSISMLAEALRTGRPVDVYRLPVRHGPHLPLERWPFSLLVRQGYLATRRDVSSFISRLIENNHVGVLGKENAIRTPLASDDEQVVAPVRALLQKR